jgi:hypothetical protein
LRRPLVVGLYLIMAMFFFPFAFSSCPEQRMLR